MSLTVAGDLHTGSDDTRDRERDVMNRFGLASVAAALAGLAATALAHHAICDCFLNDDNTITCEGGFSDGASATGIPLRVLDSDGKVLIEGVMSEKSEFTFAKPAVDFRVEFDAGEGHVVKIDGRDIEE
jgi:hypothetical protein